MPAFDRVLRGGTLLTADGILGRADIGILKGRVVQIGGEMNARAVVDARGKLVLPGGIDTHVHLSYPGGTGDEPAWIDDFSSGSRAALAGGITTLGNMTFPDGDETPLQSLARETEVAKAQTITDLYLHPVLTRPTREVLAELPSLLSRGCNSIKLFTVIEGFDACLGGFVEAMRAAGELGLITLVHCEDRALIDDATTCLSNAGKTAMRHYPESRPVVSEVVATQRAVAIAEATRAPVYIVHLSCARALEVCADAQARGVPVFVETRPLYLHLTRERFEDGDGAKYVGQPPLRDAEDMDALWRGIQQGTIHTVCTDHAPWLLADKLDPGHTITSLRPGTANLQTLMPMLYSEGVRTGRISQARFVQVTSSNAAKLFGLFPRKGTIAVGSDADLVVFDPEITRTVTAKMMLSRSDHSAFEGWQVTGWPETTLRRGEIVYHDGVVAAQPGSGHLVARGPTQRL